MRAVRIPLWRIWTGNRVRRPARRPQWRRNVWRAWYSMEFVRQVLPKIHRHPWVRKRMAAL